MAQSRTDDQQAKSPPPESEIRDADAAADEARAFEAEPQERSYEPSDLEATLARQQGLGFGARDLARQRDPSRPAPAADETDEEGEG